MSAINERRSWQSLNDTALRMCACSGRWLVVSPWFPSGLRLDLQELLGRDVEVVTERMLDAEIRVDVLREAIAL
jgi:hypothetical protein